MSGDVDGEESYQGYPFVGNGSPGYPDAGAILRSYLKHDALEVLFVGDDIDTLGSVVLDEPDLDRDELCFRVRRAQGVSWTGIDYYREAVAEASEIAARLRLSAPEALDGALLYRIGNELEADMIVTDRAWLLEKRDRSGSRHLASVMSMEEALALMGLYLRWHGQPIIIGGAPVYWRAVSMRRSAAFAALPAFERWNQAGRRWYDTSGNPTLESLNQSCLTRVSRALKFRDGVYGLSATMHEHELEEMLCELDSLLYSLVGAFDVAARIVDLILGLGGKHTSGWQTSWQKKLEIPATKLYTFTKDGSDMHKMFRVLRWLRNTVHYEALGLRHDSSSGGYVVTMPDDAQREFRDILRAGSSGWDADALHIRIRSRSGATASKWLPGTGRYTVHVTRSSAPRDTDSLAGELAIDVRGFLNRVFPAVLEALNEIMTRTPLTKIPAYTPDLEAPVRTNLPWQFSDTTAHRLRLIFGVPQIV